VNRTVMILRNKYRN